MNIKEQNATLKLLKDEYQDTLKALDVITADAISALGVENDDDIAIDWILAYLNKEVSLKDLRKKIAEDKAYFQEMQKFG